MTATDRLAEIKADLSEIYGAWGLHDPNLTLYQLQISALVGSNTVLVAALEAVLEATSKRHGPEVSQQYEMAMETIEDIITEALGADQ